MNKYLMWSKSFTPVVEAASTVVSDSGDILSPKYAPEITAPAIQASLYPIIEPMPIKAMPMVAHVVHELPVRTEITEQTMHVTARKVSGLINSRP